MTENRTDIRTALAKASARYLMGSLDDTIVNRDGSTTVLVGSRVTPEVSYLVELSRWGKLVGLTKLKDTTLSPYEASSMRFTLLSEILKAERARALVGAKRQFQDDILKGFGSSASATTDAGRGAVSAGRVAFEKVSREARPTLERAYGELKPRVERAYGEAKPVVLRVYGEVQPRLARAYGEAKPAANRIYEGARRWLKDGERSENALLLTLFGDGYLVAQFASNSEIVAYDDYLEEGIDYSLIAESADGSPSATVDLNWSPEEGFKLRTGAGKFYPGEIPAGTYFVAVVTADGFEGELVEDADLGVEL